MPIGTFALFGVLTFLLARAAKLGVKFDAFGFATLGLAISGLQALLDQGQQLDWFGSVKIRIEATPAVLSLIFFLVHTALPASVRFSSMNC